MNILYILNSGNPGGMEQHVLDLVVGMIGHGHKVFVWCCDGPIVVWYENAGAHVTTAKIGFELDPIYIWNLTKFLKQEKIDVAHAHELKACANAMLAKFLAGTPVCVTHIHTPMSEWQIPNPLKKIYTTLTIFGYVFAVKLFSDMEIALTESRKQVKMAEGIPENKLAIIPNGLDVANFNLTLAQKAAYKKEILAQYTILADSFVIGNIGRFTEEKGLDILVTAFSLFLKNLPENQNEKIYLLLAGGGKLENSIKSVIKDLTLEEKVRVTGVFPKEDHLKMFAALDLFVFPSLAEGFGIVMMEAMASGLVVVCSDLEVLGEVGGSSVHMFETGNALSLSQKLLDIYKSRHHFSIWGETAKKRVKDLYSIDKFVQNYSELYSYLFSKKERGESGL